MKIKKKTIFQTLLPIYFTISFKLFSNVIETYKICDLLPYINSSHREGYTLVLFDIDDTLVNSPIHLNSGPWITYYWQNAPKLLPEKMSVIEELMWFVSKSVPCLPVDPLTACFISSCQIKYPSIVPLALTARPVYQKNIDGIQVTKDQLLATHIDFSQIKFPCYLTQTTSFHDGIIFTSGKKKGDFLQQFLVSTKYLPGQIIFIDDKLDEIRSVEKVAQDAGIKVHCFWYRQASLNRPAFDLQLANIQLEHLLKHRLILSDEGAQKMMTEEYATMCPDDFLKQLIELYEILIMPFHQS